MDIEEICREIERTGFAACIEVTNGLKKNRRARFDRRRNRRRSDSKSYADKSNQAAFGKKHLSRITDATVEAGLFYVRSPFALLLGKDPRLKDISFTISHPSYQPEVLDKAVSLVIVDEQIGARGRNYLMQLVDIANSQGISLDSLINCQGNSWQEYERFVRRDYSYHLETLGFFKGKLTETYAGELMRTLMPKTAKIHSSFKINDREIDLLVITQRESFYAMLNHLDGATTRDS